MSSRARGWCAILAVVAATGCGGVPDGGSVHLGHALPAVGGADDAFDFDVKALPPSWRSGMSPDDVVDGFLRAVVNGDGDYAIARSYLSTAAARGWDPDRSITMYDGLKTTSSGGGAIRSVQIRALRTGAIDERGDFDPSRGSINETVGLARRDGQWRIDRLPPGVLLSTLDAQRSIRLARVYYLNRAGTALVPEQAFVRATQAGFATALIRTMLAGPGRWLAPAVRSAVPAGTALIGNVPVVNGEADVNLSPSARQATTPQLQQLSAAVVWTLHQVPEVETVRLFIDGAPVSLPRVGAAQSLSDWPGYDPAGAVSGPTLYVADGRLRAANGSAPKAGGNVVSAAVSVTANVVAVVRATRRGEVLSTGPIGGALVGRVTAATMTAPTIDPEGDVLTVATTGGRQGVTAVLGSGAVRSVPVNPPLPAAVTSLRLSRDGTRVAAVAGGQLFVGRVQVGQSDLLLAGFRNVLPTAVDVRGVAWTDAGDVVATVVTGRNSRGLVVTDVDGYADRSVNTDGVAGRPVDVVAAPGRPLIVVTAGGQVWSEGGGWHEVGRGTAAAYPD